METKIIICNGLIAGTYKTEEEKLMELDHYMRIYGLEMTAFECRTQTTQICVGLIKHQDVQYALYKAQQAHIFRNFRRGLITEFQMDKSITQIQKDWFAEWTKRKYTDNICKLTAELLSEKSCLNIEIEEEN